MNGTTSSGNDRAPSPSVTHVPGLRCYLSPRLFTTRIVRRNGPSRNTTVMVRTPIERMLGAPRSRSAHARRGAGTVAAQSLAQQHLSVAHDDDADADEGFERSIAHGRARVIRSWMAVGDADFDCRRTRHDGPGSASPRGRHSRHTPAEISHAIRSKRTTIVPLKVDIERDTIRHAKSGSPSLAATGGQTIRVNLVETHDLSLTIPRCRAKDWKAWLFYQATRAFGLLPRWVQNTL